MTGIDIFAQDGNDGITLGTAVIGAYIDGGTGTDRAQIDNSTDSYVAIEELLA